MSPPEPRAPRGTGPSGPSGAVLAALTAVVVAVLAAPVAVAIVHAAGGGDGGDSARAPSPTAAQSRSVEASPAPSRLPSQPSRKPSRKPSRQPSRQPSGNPSPTPTSPSPSETPAGPQVTCWDGSTVTQVGACSEPQGESGLTWVFPSIAGQRCASATASGPQDLVLRRICRARATGGQRIVIVYYQWSSIATARAYFARKGLARIGSGGAVEHFVGPVAGGTKVGEVYADEPFSFIATVPSGVDPDTTTAQLVSSRPAGQVRGVPR